MTFVETSCTLALLLAELSTAFVISAKVRASMVEDIASLTALCISLVTFLLTFLMGPGAWSLSAVDTRLRGRLRCRGRGRSRWWGRFLAEHSVVHIVASYIAFLFRLEAIKHTALYPFSISLVWYLNHAVDPAGYISFAST